MIAALILIACALGISVVSYRWGHTVGQHRGRLDQIHEEQARVERDLERSRDVIKALTAGRGFTSLDGLHGQH